MAIDRDRWEHTEGAHGWWGNRVYVTWLSDNICVEVFQVGARNEMIHYVNWVTQWCWFEPKEDRPFEWCVEMGHHANEDKACKEILFTMLSPSLDHAQGLVNDEPRVPTREELKHSDEEFKKGVERLTIFEFGPLADGTASWQYNR